MDMRFEAKLFQSIKVLIYFSCIHTAAPRLRPLIVLTLLFVLHTGCFFFGFSQGDVIQLFYNFNEFEAAFVLFTLQNSIRCNTKMNIHITNSSP